MYKNRTQPIDEQQHHTQRIGVTKEIDKNTSETKKSQQAMAHRTLTQRRKTMTRMQFLFSKDEPLKTEGI